MLNENNLHLYQRTGVNHILEHPYSALLLEMGLGKTITTLTALTRLLKSGESSKILIIAPKRVAEHTWSAEIDKWEHLKHLKVSKVLGSEKQRKQALKTNADIYIINRENVVWLVSFYAGAFPFDTLVIDELSSFKSPQAARFKALRRVRPLIKRVIGLTGTPAPNGLLDLWSQMYLIDMGERLGKGITQYRDKYFSPGKRNGHVVYDYKQKQEDIDLFGENYYEQEIYDKIGDICISMKAKDWLTLPERVDITRPVTLSPKVQAMYEEFEKTQVLEMLESLEGRQISAPNAAALTGKLLQFSNGAIYDSERNYHEVHNEKIEELGDLLEAANGKPVLVLYCFKSDVERIKSHLKSFSPKDMDYSKTVVDDWNLGKINVLLGHPASMGHGLNMQEGGNLIAHFGLNWSLELYQQAVARLDRQGQEQAVINSHLIVPTTYEQNVLESLDKKARGQEQLMQAVKALINKYE